MEGTAKGLVGKDVVLVIVRKPNFRFEQKVKIVGVEGGCLRVKGQSGMEKGVPFDDEYMRIDSIIAKQSGNP